MQVLNVLRAARRNTGRKKVAKNRHLGTIAQIWSGYIFATKARIDSQKKTC